MAGLNQLQQYGISFQIKVMSSLLKHKEFLQNIHDILDTEMFDNPAHKWIVGEILRYHYKYHTTPSIDSLQVEVRKIENEVLKVSVVEQLKEALKSSNEDQEYVEQEFSAFCKNQQIKKAILNSVTLLEKGQYDDIKYMMDQALKAGQDKSIGHEYEKDIETRYREEERAAVPTAWPHINELLMGGLGSGDLGIIFGNPGGGKCVGPNTLIDIQYEEIGIDLENNGNTTTIWFNPYSEFNIDGRHVWGYEIKWIFEYIDTLKT